MYVSRYLTDDGPVVLLVSDCSSPSVSSVSSDLSVSLMALAKSSSSCSMAWMAAAFLAISESSKVEESEDITSTSFSVQNNKRKLPIRY